MAKGLLRAESLHRTVIRRSQRRRQAVPRSLRASRHAASCGRAGATGRSGLRSARPRTARSRPGSFSAPRRRIARGAAGGSIAVLPVSDGDRPALQDIAGKDVAPAPACRVTLWAPSDATAEERDAWRDRLAGLRIKQPFKQVFREHYVAPPDERADATTATFAGHVVAVTPFLGLAQQERWRIDDAYLTRSFGRWTARLYLADPIYPGRGGRTTTGNLGVWPAGENRPIRLGALPAATLSEIMRAVDLLVSASSFAVMTEDADPSHESYLRRLAETPLGAMAEIRKQALKRMLRGLDGFRFDARHLRLGAYAIHLATGRVTRDGDSVAIDLPKDTNRIARPWLPYDEKLLERLYWTAIEIALRLSAPAD
jgi:hypothetical protein